MTTEASTQSQRLVDSSRFKRLIANTGSLLVRWGQLALKGFLFSILAGILAGLGAVGYGKAYNLSVDTMIYLGVSASYVAGILIMAIVIYHAARKKKTA